MTRATRTPVDGQPRIGYAYVGTLDSRNSFRD